jgi:hypothetical protein
LPFFRRPRLADSRLGELRFRRDRWTSLSASCFGETDVELSIPGTRQGISPDARQLLESVERQYPDIKRQALAHIQEHYEPYAESVDELDENAAAVVRSIRTPEALWSHLTLVRVWVGAYGNAGDVELAYETGWDVEHTIGLTISDGHVTNLCGSVGPW